MNQYLMPFSVYKLNQFAQKILAVLLLVVALTPAPIKADEIRPALLDITEREGGWVDVVWKVPMKGDRSLALQPVLPGFFESAAPPSGLAVGGAYV